MSDTTPTASVDAALAHAMQLYARDPTLAAEQARQILIAVPGEPGARLILGMALAAQRDYAQALGVLEPLAAEQPTAARVHLELGIVLMAVKRLEEAIVATGRAAQLQPSLPGVWLDLANMLDTAGQRARAGNAYLMHASTGRQDPELMAAGLALSAGQLPEAEQKLRDRLRRMPNDVAAMRMLAELGARVGRNEQALALLERCLQLAPGFAMARHNYALVLDRCSRHEDALLEVESLLAMEPDNVGLQNLKAVILGKLGNYGNAIRLYESILDKRPKEPRVWMSLGHALKTEGQTDRAIIA